ncbi:MAG TPA: alkaline phosphatase family protein, partial [Polyangiaceae bacterium]
TVFTIVFENEAATDVFGSEAPFFTQLSHQYGLATAYTSSTHPSLPNYIMMTSGSTNGIINDNDPTTNVPLQTHDNLAHQLDAKNVMWRAYMESMGDPCKMSSSGTYSAHHDPFLYYTDVTQGACAQHVVDFDQNFDGDLASGVYKYMWITPNMCDDMHNCEASVADAWLAKTVTKIMAADAYKNGGAIFILFDEGSSRAPGATAALPTIVVSPNLKNPGQPISIPYDHRSYLATVEDIFGLGRIATTQNATAMSDFFEPAAPSGTTAQ